MLKVSRAMKWVFESMFDFEADIFIFYSLLSKYQQIQQIIFKFEPHRYV